MRKVVKHTPSSLLLHHKRWVFFVEQAFRNCPLSPCYAMPFLVPFFFFFFFPITLSLVQMKSPISFVFHKVGQILSGCHRSPLARDLTTVLQTGRVQRLQSSANHGGVQGKREREEQSGRIVRKGYKGWVTPKMESVTAVVYPNPVPHYCSLCLSFPCAGV